MPSNRLIHEQSPYLLQHAENPVDWYPWGDEAFERARRENKPVFLSIGYSTCHWCHVMAHESFESPDVADVLNRHFISIKVDREERADVDHLYMTAVTAMTGHGGWPLSVFLTPEKKPFFGGTYFPPYPRWGTPGFLQVLDSVYQTWTQRQAEVAQSAETITNMLAQERGSSEDVQLGEETLNQGFLQLATRYDRVYGGFGQAPKFPSPHQLMFLMHVAHRDGKPESLQMSLETLGQMARGGIYDHIGGGFHRYATDRQWQIPHFEKMLYDQAMISRAYLEAYQISRDEMFADVARATLDYVLRDLVSDQGGFYSAEDADSVDPYDPDSPEKKEGAFYLWKQTEIIDIIGQDDAFVFNTHYQIDQDGNAHSDPHGEFEGKNIIFETGDPAKTAETTGRSLEDVINILKRSRRKILDVRSRRQRPHLDDKVLTDWNGLMIASLALGGRILRDDKYLDAAIRAAELILEQLTDPQGRLLHRWRKGQAGIAATLEDYAYLVYGLLELYQATLGARYLRKAKEFTDQMIALFSDEVSGGFYLSAAQTQDIPFRSKILYDGALPSANSMAAWNLLRLYRITFDERYASCADRVFQAFAQEVRQTPMGYTHLLSALMWRLGPVREIVITSGADGLSEEETLEAIAKFYLPQAVVLGGSGLSLEETTALAPWASAHQPVKGKTAVYICDRQACQSPVTDIHGLDQILSRGSV